MRWQRLLRPALAVFAVGFVIVLVLAIRPRPATQGGPVVERTDPEAVAETEGGVLSVARGAEAHLRVEYARLLTYADGSSRFEDVRVLVPDRNGRDYTIEGQRGQVSGNQSHVDLEGDVRLTGSDGLTVTGEKASYDNGDGMVRLPGPVAFSRGRMAGTSIGATFDQRRDVLWLLERARVTIAPDETGAGEARIEADAAGFARAEHYMRFTGAVRLERGGQVVETDSAVAYLDEAGERVELLELRGSARVSRPAPAPGGLEAMTARDMNLLYGGDGQTLERATLAGTAAIGLAGEGGRPGQRLAADFLDIGLDADGATMTSLVARDGVELELPATGATPARRIRSRVLEASGAAGKGLTNARFVDDVEFRETRAATRTSAAIDRDVRARELDADVTGGLGAIDTARFGGGVRFRDGPLDAVAPDATYAVASGRLHLAGQGTRVNDERATIQARTIDVTLDGRGLEADGDVRSVLKAAAGDTDRRRTGGEAGGAVQRPSMLRDDQPVNVTGSHMVYDSDTGQATYTGDARLWQGETAVQGATLVLDDRAGNLTATGGVRSTWRLEDTDAKTGKTETKTTIATAEQLVYEEARRLATYTTNARMNGPEGDLRAARIELFLDETGRALERAEAYEAVTLRSDLRWSVGDRLTYFAADARYVMSGAPVRIYEQQAQECRETTGRTLTFYRSTDSISVDGDQEQRTETRSGGKCPVPPAG